METAGLSVGTSNQIIKTPRNIVAIIVNADTNPDNPMDTSDKRLSNLEVVGAVTNAQIDRYSSESLSLLEVSMRDWAVKLSTPEQPVRSFLISLDFENLPNEKMRKLFNNMATSFSLPDNEVDSLIEAGNELLENSPEFQAFVTAINKD
jgi:NTE family protein